MLRTKSNEYKPPLRISKSKFNKIFKKQEMLQIGKKQVSKFHPHGKFNRTSIHETSNEKGLNFWFNHRIFTNETIIISIQEIKEERESLSTITMRNPKKSTADPPKGA